MTPDAPDPDRDALDADDGDPARGLAVGVWLALAFWAALGALAWALARWAAWPWGAG